MLDRKGKSVDSIDPPEGVTYNSFNLLTAHLFHALAGGQSMGLLGINVAKGRTVKDILQDEFPPLDQDGGKVDRLVSFRTMAYVQANMILSASYQVPCLYLTYSMFIHYLYFSLGSQGRAVRESSIVSGSPRT